MRHKADCSRRYSAWFRLKSTAASELVLACDVRRAPVAYYRSTAQTRHHLSDRVSANTEQQAEAVFQHCVAFDLAPSVTDDAAEPGAQELQFPPGAFELVGVRV
jgi:hypothetical protein